VENDRRSLNQQLDQTFQVLMYLTVPAVVGLSILAEPAFTVFYENKELGTEILRAYAPVAILFALFSVTAAILQGINEQRFTVLSLLTGLLVKLSLNIPLIQHFETEGAVLATALGYTAAILINLFVIKYFARYPFKFVARRIVLILIFSAVMGAGTLAAYEGLSELISPASKAGSILIIVICALFGAAIYAYLSFRSRLVDLLFGDKVDKIKRKLRLPI
jgi:O-antigen/teichoic acid export membrane protein